MVVREKTVYPADIEARFKEADEFNAKLKEKAVRLRELQSAEVFFVKAVRTDTAMRWHEDRNRMPSGEYNTTVINVYEKSDMSISFNGQSPNLQRGDRVAAYIFPFAYHPFRTDKIRADLLRIHREGYLPNEELLRIFKEEDGMVESLAEKPFDLQASIRHFRRDDETGFSTVGVWLRRDLRDSETAYALAKLDVEKNAIVCGPNNDFKHPYFGIKEALERLYK